MSLSESRDTPVPTVEDLFAYWCTVKYGGGFAR